MFGTVRIENCPFFYHFFVLFCMGGRGGVCHKLILLKNVLFFSFLIKEGKVSCSELIIQITTLDLLFFE